MKKIFRKFSSSNNSSRKKSNSIDDAVQAGILAAEQSPPEKESSVLVHEDYYEVRENVGTMPPPLVSNGYLPSSPAHYPYGGYSSSYNPYGQQVPGQMASSYEVNYLSSQEHPPQASRRGLSYDSAENPPSLICPEYEDAKFYYEPNPMNPEQCILVVSSPEFFLGADNFPVPRFIFSLENMAEVSDLEDETEQETDYLSQQFLFLQSQAQNQAQTQSIYQSYPYPNPTVPVTGSVPTPTYTGSYTDLEKLQSQYILTSQVFSPTAQPQPQSQSHHSSFYESFSGHDADPNSSVVRRSVSHDSSGFVPYRRSLGKSHDSNYGIELPSEAGLGLGPETDFGLQSSQGAIAPPPTLSDSQVPARNPSVFLRSLSMYAGIHPLGGSDYFDDIDVVQDQNSVGSLHVPIHTVSPPSPSAFQDSSLDYNTQMLRAIEASLLEATLHQETLLSEEEQIAHALRESLFEHQQGQEEQKVVLDPPNPVSPSFSLSRSHSSGGAEVEESAEAGYPVRLASTSSEFSHTSCASHASVLTSHTTQVSLRSSVQISSAPSMDHGSIDCEVAELTNTLGDSFLLSRSSSISRPSTSAGRQLSSPSLASPSRSRPPTPADGILSSPPQVSSSCADDPSSIPVSVPVSSPSSFPQDPTPSPPVREGFRPDIRIVIPDSSVPPVRPVSMSVSVSPVVAVSPVAGVSPTSDLFYNISSISHNTTPTAVTRASPIPVYSTGLSSENSSEAISAPARPAVFSPTQYQQQFARVHQPPATQALLHASPQQAPLPYYTHSGTLKNYSIGAVRSPSPVVSVPIGTSSGANSGTSSGASSSSFQIPSPAGSGFSIPHSSSLANSGMPFAIPVPVSSPTPISKQLSSSLPNSGLLSLSASSTSAPTSVAVSLSSSLTSSLSTSLPPPTPSEVCATNSCL